MNIKRIILDVDDLLGDHVTAWLNWYNKKWYDSLQKSDITDWDLTKFVKPECNVQIYDFLKESTVYDNVLPIKYSQTGVNFLRSLGKEIVFVTARDWACNKFDWLKKYGFTSNTREYVVAENKSLIDADMIIDDNFDNVVRYPGAKGLFTQPWNKNKEFPDKYNGNDSYRLNGWDKIVNLFGGKI